MNNMGRGKLDKVHGRTYVPLEEPRETLYGRPRLPEDQRFMRTVIRARQNIEADAKDYEREPYDWNGDLAMRWLPEQHREVEKIRQGGVRGKIRVQFVGRRSTRIIRE